MNDEYEIVLTWKPLSEGNGMVFTLDSLENLKGELEAWLDPCVGEDELGAITVEQKRVGWARTLPEHEGW